MKIIFAMAALATLAFAGPAMAGGTYDPGASDTEIKLGNTWAFSGPVSPTSPVQRQMAGYYNMINDQGGVNGRKINFIALDDGYIPPKTVEDTRKLVEQEQVLLMDGQLGTPTNVAVEPYLNSKKVPQLFVFTGSSSLINPKKYPWTMGFQSSYALESIVFAKYIMAERPNAKIGILYQDDDFGSDRVSAFMAALGDKASKMVVAKVSYAVSDPTVQSQIISLKAAGADTLYLAAQSRAAAQAISVARDQAGWNALLFLPYVASAKSVVGPVGDEKLKGVISSDSTKDPTDPAWAGDKAAQDYLAWVKKYVPAQDQESDKTSPLAYVSAQTMVEVLKEAGNTLTRANIMKIASHLHNVSFPLLLPGITLNTSPDDYFPIHTLQLKQYDGQRWVLIGKPITGS
ncbi:MAG TPA: ABC transporter substrate-binding protein [Stellaceae bacterium]|nr:ABC transporter substrate-binding protein [Stellaceae bacterium]